VPLAPALFIRRHLYQSATPAALLLQDNAFIEIFEYSAPTPAPSQPDRPVCDYGVTHVALIVDDVQAEYDRLKALGVLFHAPPREDFRAVYGRDPDGNVFELMEVSPDSKIALDI
jgi:catechol 2,3-dioxygenase-like lactoylglutathione lyase family enzyme